MLAQRKRKKMTFMLQKFAIVKYCVFVAKICKRALRASIQGYLAVSASTPTSATLGTGME